MGVSACICSLGLEQSMCAKTCLCGWECRCKSCPSAAECSAAFVQGLRKIGQSRCERLRLSKLSEMPRAFMHGHAFSVSKYLCCLTETESKASARNVQLLSRFFSAALSVHAVHQTCAHTAVAAQHALILCGSR